LYPPHNISSVHLKTTYVWCTGRITNGMRNGWTAQQDSAFSSPAPAPTLPEWPSQEEPGSGSTASALVSDVSAPACTNGVWPPLRPVSVAQKNKPSTMLSSNVQSINFPMDCMAWRFSTMRQSNGCSTPALRSSAAKQWFKNNSLKRRRRLAGSFLSRNHSLAAVVHERLEWSLADQSSELSETEWLCVEVAGCKIINVYKPPRSRFTPSAIPTFPHPSLYVGDFNCQHVNRGYNRTSPEAKAWTPGQHPTILDCCIIQRKQPVSSLADGTSAPTQTWP